MQNNDPKSEETSASETAGLPVVESSALLGPLLTQEECEGLADGERVMITWSGGNGPHEYEVGRDKRGFASVVHRIPGIGPEAGKIYKHTHLRFVGKERYHTHVQRILGPNNPDEPITAPAIHEKH